MTASSPASATYSAPPTGANALSVPSTSNAVPAVRPVCRYREDPSGAPAIGGSAAAWSPCSGGSPATWA